jgi:hypothetical protein
MPVNLSPHPKSLSLRERDLKSVVLNDRPFSLMEKGSGVEG